MHPDAKTKADIPTVSKFRNLEVNLAEARNTRLTFPVTKSALTRRRPDGHGPRRSARLITATKAGKSFGILPVSNPSLYSGCVVFCWRTHHLGAVRSDLQLLLIITSAPQDSVHPLTHFD